MADTLPEGTDHVLPGSSETSNPHEDATEAAASLRDRAAEKASLFKDQATDKARIYAEEGKTRATGALDSVVQMMHDGASQIDDKLGASYGDYARKAAEAVSGFTDTLREKDVDELLDDARDLVRRSPALAIGAAAAAGFVLARLIKTGSETLDQAAKAASPAPSAAKADKAS